jgi:hypothetical protein
MSEAGMWVDSLACSASRWWQIPQAHMRGAVCMLRPPSTGCLESAIHWQIFSNKLDCHCSVVSFGGSVRILSISKGRKPHQNLRASDGC